LSLREFLFCHCEERSDEAVPLFVTASEAKQSHEIASPNEKTRLAVTLFVGHCERNEAILPLDKSF
jgi:hypothetical protein